MRIFSMVCIILLVGCAKSKEISVSLAPVDTIPAEQIPQETDTVKKIEVTLNDSIKLKYPKVAYDGFAR